MSMLKKIVLNSVFAGVLLVSGPVLAVDVSHQNEDVMKIIAGRKDLGKFAELIDSAGLKDYFAAKDDSLTVFAPSDEALSKAPSDVMKRAKANKESLASFVKYHTINGSQVFEGNVRGRRAGPSAGNGEGLSFDGVGKDPKVNSAKFVASDIAGSNGVLHVMDSVLIPPSIALSEEEKAKQQQQEQEAMKKREEEMTKAREEMDKKREAEMAKEAAKSGAKTDVSAAAKAPQTPATTTEASKAAPTAKQVEPASKSEKKSGGFLKMLGF